MSWTIILNDINICNGMYEAEARTGSTDVSHYYDDDDDETGAHE